MAIANQAKSAPLGRDRNPYEFLRAPDVEEARQIADMKTAGTVTDQAVEELRQERRRALSLAVANHRERIRALAWRMLRTREAPPVDMQYEFLADKRGDCTVLSLVSLIAAEVTANDYPHDLPFHPDAHELAEAISRNHRSALQIVKDRIRTGSLPVRAVTGIPVAYNDDPAVLAWCNDIEAIRPPQALTTTLADARALVQAIELNPLRELAGESAPIPEQVTELAGELAPPSDQAPNVPAKEAPPDLEAPKQIGRHPKTGRMTEAKRAIRAILHAAGPALSKGDAYSFVMQAICNAEVPSPFQIKEGTDESGRWVFVWTDTKKKEHAIEPATLKRYVRDAWKERDQAPR